MNKKPKILIYIDSKIFYNFISKVNKTDTCWVWNASRMSSGYGQFWVNRNKIGAHQFSFIYYNERDLKSGDVVMHICDNKLCVNPKHLKIGTQKDNIHDMLSKGRQRKIKTYSSGENHVNSKLSNEQAKQIRKLYATGDYTWVGLAKIYSISKRCAGYIIQNVTYKE